MNNLGRLVEVVDTSKMAFYTRKPPIGSKGIVMSNTSLLTLDGRLPINSDTELVQIHDKTLHQSISSYVRTHIDFENVRGRQWIETGSDPEVFAVDENNVVLPAWKFLPPKPKTITHSHPYWDGFQAEWTIMPDTCHSYTVDYIQEGLKNTLMAARLVDANAKLTWQPVLEIPNKMLVEAAPQYVELGCAPSKNGYTIKDHVLRGVVGRDLLVRFAGFHIHFGIPNLRPALARHMVKQLDRVLATFFVAVLADMDNPIRRRFYGRAGEYRLPAHGLEYRVLSSAVLAHPALVHLAFDLGRLVVMHAVGGISLIDGEDAMFVECINNCDVMLARKIIKDNANFYKSAFKALYCFSHDNAIHLSQKSAKEILQINSMENNWKLCDVWQTHSDGTNESFSNSFIDND